MTTGLDALDAAPEANRDTTVRSGASLRRQCLSSPFRWYGFWAVDGAHSKTKRSETPDAAAARSIPEAVACRA